MDAVKDNCCLLLLVLGVVLFLFASHWAFKKTKAFRVPPCLRKSQGKSLAAWLTSFEESKISEAKRVQRSIEDQSLYHTLHTLDRTYIYLAKKIKELDGQISRSVSCSSVESVTSLCGSLHRSLASSSSKSPPSLTPAALARAAEGGRPRRDTGVHAWRRIRFLGYKEQKLLEWHVQRKHWNGDVPTYHRTLRVEAKVQADTVKVHQGGPASPQLPPCQGPPPRAVLHICQTPSKPPSMRRCSPEPCPPAPSPKGMLPSPILICPSQSRSSLWGMTGGKSGSGNPKEQLTELLCLLEQNKSPPAREARQPGTPKKEVTEVLCLLEQNKPPTAREARRSGTPKKEITEVLCVLEQNSRPGSPNEREKEGRSSSRRPSAPKEPPGKADRPKDKALDVKISMTLDQKPHRLTWAEATPEAPKAIGTWAEPASAHLQLLQPPFMCQNQRETPSVPTAQIQLHQESRTFAKCHPLARAIVESLDKEQARQDLHLCLATSAEKGRGFMEYPVCLLCGRCTTSCPHLRLRHNPSSLLVYPRFSSQDSQTCMDLSYILKIKRQEADRFGLAPVVELCKGSRGGEPPSKLDRRQSKHGKSREAEAAARSRAPEGSRRGKSRAAGAAPQPRTPEGSRRGKSRAAKAAPQPRTPEGSRRGKSRAAGAAPQPRTPEGSRRGKSRAAEPRATERAPHPLRPSTEAVDLRVRGQGEVPLSPKDSFTLAAEHSHKLAGAEAGAWPAPPKAAKPSPCIFKVMCRRLKIAWAKVCGKGSAPPSKVSPRKPPPPQVAGDPSTDFPASEIPARRGILRQGSLISAEESFTELAAPPTAKPAAAHGRRKVSLRVTEPETSRLPKKGDRRQPKSAASKKPRQRK